MSYVPSHIGASFTLAQPESLVFFDVEIDGTCSVGSIIEYLNPTTQFGAWSASVSNGVITLPAGYFYFIEATTQFFPLDDFYGHVLETQLYDETNSQYVGQKTLLAPQITEQDDQATSRPDTARALIDCTSSGITISHKILADSGETTPVNYDGHAQYLYGSFGRCVIWKLEA